MKDIRFITLYSGSEGNSTYVSVGDTEILIDAGKSAKALCRSLESIGTNIERISAIFITHEHHDHVSALEVISKHRDIPIHIMERSAEKFDMNARYSAVHKNFVRHSELFCEHVGELTVSCFKTPHDSRMSVGYRIEFRDRDRLRAVGVATDIGYVTDDILKGLYGCEAVVLESNHDFEMLEQCSYPQDLKHRIRSKGGHLSNRDSACLAVRLSEGGTRGFILAHISRESNCPQMALDEYICNFGRDDIEIVAADPDCPSELHYFAREAELIDKYKAYNGG